ncbi:LysM repeat protein [Dysgonomonas hofstadii]|uniref:LysM repeat protein n=1 Tax=Dysgonomonas hofstadii TaxID=637886 RepID=A0A840CNN6_9BACT|nr:LysM peptidoglycan-binding domain-containing protein [Dysgonomonas hofstadii]MBB4036289.1 LysM repeat protein [Dysgonomonas hofstadii]
MINRTRLFFLFLSLFIIMAGSATNEDRPENYISGGGQSRVYQAHAVISYHKVNKGETLKSIARSNDVSVENIQKWNDLESDYIQLGTELKIQKIEFILIEEPQLKAPLLAEISIDKGAATKIMEDYMNNMVPETSSSGMIDSYERILALTEKNFEDYEITLKKEKNVWGRISGVANIAFNSVKGWGKDVFAKPKEKKGTDVLLADNNKIQIEERSEKENISLEEIKIEPEKVFPKGDNWKKIYHKVRFGETMTQIAFRYQVSKNDIVQWNNLPCDIANVKQRLLIFVPKDFTLAQYQKNTDNRGIEL